MRASILTTLAGLSAVLACQDPSSHSCASLFYSSTSLASSFCATFTASTVTATSAIPSAILSACSSKTSSISSACTCFVTGATASSTSTTTTAKTTSTTSTTLTTTTKTSTAALTTATGVGATSIVSTLTGGSGVGGTTCTVTAYASVTAAMSSCSNILLSGLTIPASSTLSVKVPTSGALLFAGTMTVEYTPDASYTPIVLKGTNAKVAGLAGAVIDGQGAKYWDGQGSNGGTAKPDHFIKLSDMTSSSVSQLKVQNWPTHLFEITGCTDVTLTDLILDNSAGNVWVSSGKTAGHNTDVFDVSSTDGLHISGATVHNQDDCVAVNSGSNMVFENLYCEGGHGLSIGSIKNDVTVSNITFQHSSVINSANGCRIKTVAGDTGSTVSGVTYSNIYLYNISSYAIDVQQDYENGSPTGVPTTGITVDGITFEYISGNVVNSDAYKYYILCGSTSSCYDFTWSNVDITGGLTECSPSGAECP